MNAFWDGCLDHFKTVLSAQQFKTWVQPLDGSVHEEEIIIIAPNRFLLVWARDNYSKDFRQLGKDILGATLPIKFSLKVSAPVKVDPAALLVNVEPAASPPETEHKIKSSVRPPLLNATYTFDSFVTGRGNQLARAAAIQVCDNPAVAYNPLFIYGGVGLGKKARTQEEFFYLFNALMQSKKQVIMTCDTFPKEISGMEDRLVSRFGSGLTVAIEPPELELRVAILLKKAEMESIALPEEVAFFVATHIRSNVRELEGALKRISAYANFTKEPVSVLLAKEALKDLLASNSKLITIDVVQKCVADYYKLKVSDMFSKKRTRSIARPRQMAMALSKELTNHSLPDIGDAYGGRDHTTVLHACRKIAELRTTDTNITRDFNALIQILRG